ncbi:MAG: SPOR domain-containing protein [Paludibacteraceae bacterium]|nr:SPOR domain-containing protein [Paludibacteraceae bacterium]
MKRYFGIIIFAVLVSLQMRADDSIVVSSIPRPNLLEEMTGVEVIQDSTVAQLLDGAMNGAREWVEIDGYRVQVYSSNQQQSAKAEALDLEEQLKQKINQTIYVQYIPPFWKVRIGDFRTYDEAKEYKKAFVQIFPDMTGDTYIVRDKIKVLQ